jgi:tetratricopeptide (TPR) repeat protein
VQAALDKFVRGVAEDNRTLDLPETFLNRLQAELATTLFYFFVEIAIKENEKAREQINFESAIKTYRSLWRIEGTLAEHGHKLDSISDKLDQILESNRQQLAQKPTEGPATPEFSAEDRRIAVEALRSSEARIRAKAAIVAGDPARARKELEASGQTVDDAFEHLTTMGDSFYFEGEFDQAILWYESAYSLPGRDQSVQARMNLALAIQQTRIADAAKHLERAISLHRGTLLLQTPGTLNWAMTQNNLGNALTILGERENETARLEEAVTAYREALKERTRERVPLNWAMTQNNLGTALRALGERENETARLEEAVTTYRGALEVFEAGNAEYYASVVKRNLSATEAEIERRRSAG